MKTRQMISLLAGVSPAPCPGCSKGLGLAPAGDEPADSGVDWVQIALIALALLTMWAMWTKPERKVRKRVRRAMKQIQDSSL